MYTLKDLIRMFDISERTIRRHLQDEYLRGTKKGRTWYFSKKQIDNYLESSVMKKYKEKNSLANLFDYLNGFKYDDDTTIIYLKKKENDSRTSKDIAEYVSKYHKPFSLDVSIKGKETNITFIGSRLDGVDFINYLEDYNKS